MSSRLLDRLRAVLHESFVGRADELALFRTALTAETLPFNVLYIHGPGGIGKTSLLREFADICKQVAQPYMYIDARSIDPTPVGFQNALRQALNLPQQTDLNEYFDSNANHFVIGVDAYEVLAPLDEWLLKHFLPQLPEQTLLIIASRQPPSTAWRTDPGWQALTKVVALRNLTPEESSLFLRSRAVPESQHRAILRFTHGHPLALSLVADVFAQRGNVEFAPEANPDIVKTLLERFVQEVPGPAHRTALEACALIRLTTEPLLAAMLATPDVHELFEWLRSLSFIEYRPGGLVPHDLAREALVADLRWRNPDWYAELKRRARTVYTEHIASTTGNIQQKHLLDLVYLHRDNAMVRPYVEWQTSGSILVDVYQESDLKVLLDMVSLHEGERSARYAGHWLARQPGSVLVMRDSDGNPVGFLMLLDLEPARRENDLEDPAVDTAGKYLDQHAPLREGERATLFRYWMAAGSYQAVSHVQSLISLHIVRYCLTMPGLAFTFIPCADWIFWEPAFSYADLDRIPEADFEVGGRKYGVYGHDWRMRPPAAWLELLAEREVSTSFQPDSLPAEPAEQLLVLSREAFRDAVRAFLRAFTKPEQLRENPLLFSRLVVSNTKGEANEAERIKILSQLVLLAAESLKSSPRTDKFFRTLDRTYFHPAPSQEVAAELLDLPFSTYRRHLRAGIERVTELLWQQEISQ